MVCAFFLVSVRLHFFSGLVELEEEKNKVRKNLNSISILLLGEVKKLTPFNLLLRLTFSSDVFYKFKVIGYCTDRILFYFIEMQLCCSGF